MHYSKIKSIKIEMTFNSPMFNQGGLFARICGLGLGLHLLLSLLISSYYLFTKLANE